MLWVIVSWQGFALVYRLGLAGEIDIIARCPRACNHALAPISTWFVLGVESASALELFLDDVHARKCLLALWSAKGRRPTMVPLSMCWRTVQRFNDLLACTSKRNRIDCGPPHGQLMIRPTFSKYLAMVPHSEIRGFQNLDKSYPSVVATLPYNHDVRTRAVSGFPEDCMTPRNDSRHRLYP